MAQAELEDLIDDPLSLAAAMERVDELRNRLDVTEKALDEYAETANQYEAVLKRAHEADIPAPLFDAIENVLGEHMGLCGDFRNFDLWLETRE